MTVLELSAAQLGDKISRGELTSAEVTAFFIERIEKYNLDVNAVIDTRFDKALTEAKLADEKRAAGSIDGPLHGVPMTIKDAFEVVGLTCDVGYPAFAGRFPNRCGGRTAFEGGRRHYYWQNQHAAFMRRFSKL